uniref:Uncharacterized protein n=1 Tax=Meloidogyne hapla TaxID=6305 RepID=A0A1I8B0A4_MELHA
MELNKINEIKNKIKIIIEINEELEDNGIFLSDIDYCKYKTEMNLYYFKDATINENGKRKMELEEIFDIDISRKGVIVCWLQYKGYEFAAEGKYKVYLISTNIWDDKLFFIKFFVKVEEKKIKKLIKIFEELNEENKKLIRELRKGMEIIVEMANFEDFEDGKVEINYTFHKIRENSILKISPLFDYKIYNYNKYNPKSDNNEKRKDKVDEKK